MEPEKRILQYAAILPQNVAIHGTINLPYVVGSRGTIL
jgi:hypothetical protein